TLVEQGAPAHVFASANAKNIVALSDQNLVEQGVVFAYNDLVIVVPQGNPAQIASVQDLATANRIIVAAEAVPVGYYTEQMLQRAALRFGDDFPRQVRSRIISEELNTRQVLNKIRFGEGEAGIVYR